MRRFVVKIEPPITQSLAPHPLPIRQAFYNLIDELADNPESGRESWRWIDRSLGYGEIFDGRVRVWYEFARRTGNVDVLGFRVIP